MESKVLKRQRSENWLEEDKIILKELIRERVLILENKNTDANTNAKKVAAWHDLRTSFNNMAKTPRTLQQLKAQWGIIKMTAKKQKCQERKERLRTGGGPPPPSESPSGDDIAVWLPHEFTVDSNQFDSDNQFQTLPDTENQKQKVIPLPNSPVLCDNSGLGNTQLILEQCIDEDKPCTSKQPEPSTSSQAEPNTSSQAEPSTSSQAEPSTSSQAEPKNIKPKTPNYGPKNKKMSKMTKDSAVQQIAKTETDCRKELHQAQLANEKQKLKNLQLEEEVLKYKLQYYKNKFKCYLYTRLITKLLTKMSPNKSL
ncbi:unnamed protein product [Chrysodeixis includens]|uniref:Regulatory protein zeste n=1 Tax=Chrysodeixis includens TaxID=689277 RepID=A0A9P0BI92_CHRIL|nr:unnamed protein product [Chrysodeixis includens]